MRRVVRFDSAPIAEIKRAVADEADRTAADGEFTLVSAKAEGMGLGRSITLTFQRKTGDDA